MIKSACKKILTLTKDFANGICYTYKTILLSVICEKLKLSNEKLEKLYSKLSIKMMPKVQNNPW